MYSGKLSFKKAVDCSIRDHYLSILDHSITNQPKNNFLAMIPLSSCRPTRELPARPIPPSELPGVRASSAELDDEVRRDLTPGKYYEKSMTRYLGPYDNIPTKDMLASGESYVILQEMGRITTGLVLRKVTRLDC